MGDKKELYDLIEMAKITLKIEEWKKINLNPNKTSCHKF